MAALRALKAQKAVIQGMVMKVSKGALLQWG